MKNNNKVISLKTFLLVFLISILAFFFVALLYNANLAIHLMESRTISDSENTTDLYTQELQESLSRIDAFLYSTVTTDYNYNRLTYTDSTDSEWFYTVDTLNSSFRTASYMYIADALFCYKPSSSIFIFGSHTSFKFHDAKSIVLELEDDTKNFDKWNLTLYEGEYYLTKLSESRGIIIGSIIKTDTISQSLSIPNDYLEGLYFNSNNSDEIVRAEDAPITLSSEILDSDRWIGTIDDSELLFIKRTLTDDINLVRLVQMSDLRQYYKHFRYLILFTLVLAFLLWIFMASKMMKMILKPVDNLTKALGEVGKGNLKSQLSTTDCPSEFITMSDAYNDMITQIENLKIDAYELQIEHQQLETQYLKQQIAPHFMINCLNTAYQLTEFGELELSKKMLRSLSDHLRYILSSKQKVSLKNELDLVDNYIEMSKIRYPECIDYKFSVSDDIMDATVVPLMILNFVENTIKHNASMGKHLEIIVSADYKEDSQNRLLITISDSGKGFDDETLKTLQNITHESQDDNTHIGIQNTILRAIDALPTTTFGFSNTETGTGAHIEIDMPYRRYHQ
ncbi:MAG: histidine kinase [Butyrivibrio sp.]|nr:histidine kinase [Butyrivibrio sp.]